MVKLATKYTKYDMNCYKNQSESLSKFQWTIRRSNRYYYSHGYTACENKITWDQS